MHITTIIIAPIPTRRGYFTARCDGRLLCRSRQPLLDGARELLASGYPAGDTIIMKSAGSEVDAMTSTIGAAAMLTVTEEVDRPPRFRRWKARDLGEGSPPIAPRKGSATSLWLEAAE
jgi:hypothetical protein